LPVSIDTIGSSKAARVCGIMELVKIAKDKNSSKRVTGVIKSSWKRRNKKSGFSKSVCHGILNFYTLLAF
jgi:hypothetical protein